MKRTSMGKILNIYNDAYPLGAHDMEAKTRLLEKITERICKAHNVPGLYNTTFLFYKIKDVLQGFGFYYVACNDVACHYFENMTTGNFLYIYPIDWQDSPTLLRLQAIIIY
uniref:Uncharacterized protein n=1 Tax=Siphoviridae sp. ctLdn10 TaxID=2827847 RepID=A0A8S5SQM1_9CAUD|nr:MAG TPA: hypothetical protein [Siphoviridae sp. ctLdn10]